MYRKPKLKINNLNLQSVSCVQIPHNLVNFQNMQPSVRLQRLKIGSASSFHIPSSSINTIFLNGPKVQLSPLKKSILRKFKVKRHSRFLNKRHRVFPTINKCSSERCKCCKALSTKSTIKSLVNGRVFSVKLTSDFD